MERRRSANRERRRCRQRGSAVVEFALLSFVWIPLISGLAIVGFNLVHAFQANRICRNAGRMFASGVDFTQAQNLSTLTAMTADVNVQASTGDGALVLSSITLVTDDDCASYGLNGGCQNRNKYVFTSFFAAGNSTYAKTTLGDPPSAYLLGNSAIDPSVYVNTAALEATNISSFIQLPAGQSGQVIYSSELNLNSQWIDYKTLQKTGIYARFFF